LKILGLLSLVAPTGILPFLLCLGTLGFGIYKVLSKNIRKGFLFEFFLFISAVVYFIAFVINAVTYFWLYQLLCDGSTDICSGAFFDYAYHGAFLIACISSFGSAFSLILHMFFNLNVASS